MRAGIITPLPRAGSLEDAGLMLLSWVIVLAVAVVPLLVNLSSLDDTYYAGKARALAILMPIILTGLVASGGIAHLRKTRLLAPLVAFAAVVTLATAFSVDPRWSVGGAPQRHEGLLSLLAYAAVCGGSSVVVARGGLRLWLAAVLTGGTLVGLYGIWQYFGFELIVRDPVRVDWWRPFSTSGNANFFGAYMVLLVPLATAALATARHRGMMILSAVSLPVASLAALCTYSRAAWLSLGFAVVVFGILAGSHHKSGGWSLSVRRRLSLSAFLVVVLAVLFFMPGGPLANRRADWTAPTRARTSVDLTMPDSGVNQRLYLWHHAISLWLKRPLLGYGPETFALVLPQGWDADRARLFGESPARIDKAHNDTLDLAMSAGLLGVAAFWSVLIVAAKRAWEVVSRGGAPQVLGIAVLAATAGYWTDVQWHFSVVSVAPVFWSVLGAAAGMADLRTTG